MKIFIIIKEKWDTVRQQSKNMMRVCLFAYLMIKSKPDEFDVEFERNALKKLIEFFESEEKKKQNELIQYEDYLGVY